MSPTITDNLNNNSPVLPHCTWVDRLGLRPAVHPHFMWSPRLVVHDRVQCQSLDRLTSPPRRQTTYCASSEEVPSRCCVDGDLLRSSVGHMNFSFDFHEKKCSLTTQREKKYLGGGRGRRGPYYLKGTRSQHPFYHPLHLSHHTSLKYDPTPGTTNRLSPFHSPMGFLLRRYARRRTTIIGEKRPTTSRKDTPTPFSLSFYVGPDPVLTLIKELTCTLGT